MPACQHDGKPPWGNAAVLRRLELSPVTPSTAETVLDGRGSMIQYLATPGAGDGSHIMGHHGSDRRKSQEMSRRNSDSNIDTADKTDKTLLLCAAAVLVYWASTCVVSWLPHDTAAERAHTTQVPVLLYQMTATAFLTAFLLNLTSFVFEDSVAKRQLALLSCTIKGIACHSDLLMITGQAMVMYDARGALFVPHRSAHWLVTTPLMVYILSKISDFTARRTAMAAAADVVMVISGLMAHLATGLLHWVLFSASSGLFVFVMYEMGAMILSAIRANRTEAGFHPWRSPLAFIYVCTVVIWSLFPIAYLSTYLQPHAMLRNEALYMFANFTAKVLFSSSIMYGNYMTIGQRKLQQRAVEENQTRITLVTELKTAVTRKDQFMSLMSHELRTPLNGIIQLSDAMCRGSAGELTAKGSHFMTTIKNSSNHLLNIINDILDVAALKEGKLSIKHEMVDLAKAVGHVVDILRPLAKKEVRIEQYVDPNTPMIVADFSRMVQILYNLAGNALKFTKAGHVRVMVGPRDVTGATVTIRVEDTGIGIPEDKIPSIWGAFEQVDMSVTRKYGGTGLGLNIVQQLVASHNGTILCESVEGQGTAFLITLPVLQRNMRTSLEEKVRVAATGMGYSWDTLCRASSQTPGRSNSAGQPPATIATPPFQSGGSTWSAKAAIGDTPPPPPAAPAGVGRRSHQPGNSDGPMPSGASGPPPARSNSQSLSLPQSRYSFMGQSGDLVQGGERLIKQRTLELERENMMNDLARRTEHKRSLDQEADSWRVSQSQIQMDSGTMSPREPGRPAPVAIPGPSGMMGESGNLPIGSNGSTPGQEGGIQFSPGRAAAAVPGWASPGSRGGVGMGMRGGRAANGMRGANYFPLTELTSSEDDDDGGRVKPTANNPLNRSSFFMIGGSSSGAARKSHSGLARPSGPGIAMRKLSNGRPGSAGGGRCMTSDSEGGSDVDESAVTQRHMRNMSASSKSKGTKGLPVSTMSRTNTSMGGLSCLAGLSLDKLAHSALFGTVQILSVDDEEVNQIVLEEILTSVGYGYARAMDGVEALAWLEEQQTLPDLILLDCMMPNMSGHEFCTRLRQFIPSSVLPVIMVSAKSDNDNIVEGLRSGSNDFVRKPYQREELLARIETQLRLKSDSWWLAELMNNQDGRETESMKLLKNILPESIIQRMQSGQKFVADSHKHVVILFSDIVGFTNLSSKLPTAEVFLMLSNMFNAFDKLTDRFAVYKVETIGDAYMVAAGHDEDNKKAKKGSPIDRVVAMAKAMVDVVKNITAPNGDRLRIRIGIHCGPAFAGVIGSKCPRYCFLGDTVNTASRMESLSFPMCIQLSASTTQAWPTAQDQVVCLGERQVKGKGIMTTYLLKYGEWEQGRVEYEKLSLASAASSKSCEDPDTVNSSSAITLTRSNHNMGGGQSIGTEVVNTPQAQSLLTTALYEGFFPNGISGPSSSSTSPRADLVTAQSELQAARDQIATFKGQLAEERNACREARVDAEYERARATAALDKMRSFMEQLASQRNNMTLHATHSSSSDTHHVVPSSPSSAFTGRGRVTADSPMTRKPTLRFLSDDTIPTKLPPDHDSNLTANVLTFSQSPTMSSGQVRPIGHLRHSNVGHVSSNVIIRLAKSGYGLPAVSLRQLLLDLGLDALVARFEAESIKLDQLLTMEFAQLQALGLQPLGYCLRVRSAVTELAASLLRLCEEQASHGVQQKHDDADTHVMVRGVTTPL